LSDSGKNRLSITGALLERKPVRYTPAGVPVVEAQLGHRSDVLEAGVVRQIELEMPVVALGETARWLESAGLGQAVEIEGFLAQKSKSSRLLVLHVNTLKFV